jgi:hypothetical protein
MYLSRLKSNGSRLPLVIIKRRWEIITSYCLNFPHALFLGGCFFFILQLLPSSHAFQYWHASRLNTGQAHGPYGKTMEHMEHRVHGLCPCSNTWSMGLWSMPVFKQAITNMLALPVDKMLYIYLLCPLSEHSIFHRILIFLIYFSKLGGLKYIGFNSSFHFC